MGVDDPLGECAQDVRPQDPHEASAHDPVRVESCEDVSEFGIPIRALGECCRIHDRRRYAAGPRSIDAGDAFAIGNDTDDVVDALISIQECLQVCPAAGDEDDDPGAHAPTLPSGGPVRDGPHPAG